MILSQIEKKTLYRLIAHIFITMGNSNNPSMKARMRNVPGQPYGYGRNPRVPGSLNGYDFYANQYPPAQYGNYAYPPNKPVLSSDQYLQNEFFGQPQANYVSTLL